MLPCATTHIPIIDPFVYLSVFLSGSWVIKVIRENDVEVTLHPPGTETWSRNLSIDEMGGRYAVVDADYYEEEYGLWTFTHDGK